MSRPPDDAYRERVGLLPAAGVARRVQPLPCSKEIFPVGIAETRSGAGTGLRVVSQSLLEQIRRAGARKVYVVVRKGKWDIPAYWGNGRSLGLDLAYLIMERPFGVPFTLDAAYPFVDTATVLFGFPDILLRPEDTFEALLRELDRSKAEIVLGMFPAPDPRKVDMVETDANGRPRRIVIKPRHSDLRHAWLNAVWTPVFTAFLHDFVAGFDDDGRPDAGGGVSERHLGHVIQAAMAAGIPVSGVVFEKGRFIDIGTPDDLSRAGAFLATPPEG